MLIAFAVVGLCFLPLAVEAQDSSPEFSLLRIQQREAAGEHQAAFDELSERIKSHPDEHQLYHWRGRQAFCLGKIEESLENFDHYFEHSPNSRSRLWERGIALYYAERFDDGAKQFSSYQTFDNADVENAIWHFLCVARQEENVDRAREEMLSVRGDFRIPMMEIYRLYQGNSTPEKVLAMAEKAKTRKGSPSSPLFYAHLYVGLFYEVNGDETNAVKHLRLAREQKIGHYMWNVADVHVELIKSQME